MKYVNQFQDFWGKNKGWLVPTMIGVGTLAGGYGLGRLFGGGGGGAAAPAARVAQLSPAAGVPSMGGAAYQGGGYWM